MTSMVVVHFPVNYLSILIICLTEVLKYSRNSILVLLLIKLFKKSCKGSFHFLNRSRSLISTLRKPFLQSCTNKCAKLCIHPFSVIVGVVCCFFFNYCGRSVFFFFNYCGRSVLFFFNYCGRSVLFFFNYCGRNVLFLL